MLRWFEITGGTLPRHLYLPDRLIADSPVAAPAGWSLARLADPERSIMLARALQDGAYSTHTLRAEDAAKLAAFVAFILLAAGLTPGRLRIGLTVARRSPFRRLRRGHVILVIMVFGMTLTPLTCMRPAHAGGWTGSPPPGSVFAVYFVHGDHLGSTVMLTCYKQGATCPDASVVRYYRYDAYGQTKAYDVNGNAVAPGTTLVPQSGVSYVPERLYTGQRQDWQAQVYYYGARFYDPKVANFLTEDPARQYANAYAYVGWNPTKFVDPTGMSMLAGLGLSIQVQMAVAACNGGCENAAAAAALAGGAYASGTGLAAQDGGATSANPFFSTLAAAIAAALAAQGGWDALAQAAAQAILGEAYGTLSDFAKGGMKFYGQKSAGDLTVRSTLQGTDGGDLETTLGVVQNPGNAANPGGFPVNEGSLAGLLRTSSAFRSLVNVQSGQRSPSVNAQVGGRAHSYHLTQGNRVGDGTGVDFTVVGTSNAAVRDFIFASGIFSGAGFNNVHVHGDLRAAPFSFQESDQ